MDQVILYTELFVGAVVYAVDMLIDWLTAHGFSSGVVVIGIIGAVAFSVLDKWSIGIEKRLQAIESKLGIERAPPIKKKSHWWGLLAWFIVAVYILGKSLQAESSFAFAVGIALSALMLLLCAFCAYCFIDQAVRDHWRKKREIQELLDKVYEKEETN
jgi:hypothetical protein